MTNNFAVTSKHFSLYQAFKTEAEKVGWVYNADFNPFDEEEGFGCSCLYFTLDWHGEGPMFSFSNHSGIVFNLQTQWNDAIDYMSKLFSYGKPKAKVTISLKDLAEHHGVNVNDIVITS